MTKKITIKTDDVTGDNYLDLEEVLDGTNVTVEEVDQYELRTEGENLVLVLYDKNGNLLKVEYGAKPNLGL
jgi:hypothetical protein